MSAAIVITDAQRICADIRRIATGRVEWRVQHPVEKCYCMAFSRDDSWHPENEAREWLADHQRRFPDSPYAQYEVAEVRVFSALELVALEAADALASGGAVAPQAPAPYAYAIYIAAEQREELVHSLDEAMDELTNCECSVTPLYAGPRQSDEAAAVVNQQLPTPAPAGASTTGLAEGGAA